MKTQIAAVSLLAIALSACSQAESENAEPTSIASTAEGCAALTAESLGAVEAASEWIAAADALPAFCQVTAKLSPVEGSNIGVVYRLPEVWNGKLLGLGGGGWAGNVTIQAATDGLSKGYATLQTDGGHESTEVWENGWAQNPEAAIDFAHRAVHEMTVAGKALAANHYGQSHDQAVFNGCSTGGRMALMEAQKYPEDYDAIIAGAPVYTLQVQTTSVFRNQTFSAQNGAAGFTPADLQLAQDASLKACDANDGLEDGMIANPRSCDWQPSTLQCDGEKTDSCLSAPQVTALNAAYDGVKASDGSWAMFPMSRGGEASWSMFVGTDGTGNDITGGGGLVGLQSVIFGEEAVDWNAFSDANYLKVRASEFAGFYEAAGTDLSAFFGNGGKLMLWHGEIDAGPSPVGTNEYAQAVMAANPQAADQFAYYTLPGVAHCRGGPGADGVDYVAAMEGWNAKDEAPQTLIGNNAESGITRPHCAWPNVAQFGGEGEPNDPENWSCIARDS